MFKRQVKLKIFFYLTVDILCSVLGNEKVDVYHVPSQKKAAEFYERLPQTLRNVLNFVLEKNIVSLKFSGIMNSISEQKISHVTDLYVTADLYQARLDKPQNRLALQNKHAVDCSRVYTVCLHLEQAFETLLEEMKLDTDLLEETFPSYNLNFYFYFYFYTYTWQRLPITPR